MVEARLQTVVEQAELACQEAGVRFTPKRQQVFLELLRAKKPLSAYVLADHYRARHGKAMPAMSVYRILEFLIRVGLVHKLGSTNQFVACEHITCKHDHQVPQFLICDRCNNVNEVGVDKEFIRSLQQTVATTGFQLASPQLELHGLCENCLPAKG